MYIYVIYVSVLICDIYIYVLYMLYTFYYMLYTCYAYVIYILVYIHISIYIYSKLHYVALKSLRSLRTYC
jgi:hypothetical protein